MKEPGEISVLEVLRAVEGQLAPVSCLVENTECGMECEICSTKSTWGEMWEQILDTAGCRGYSCRYCRDRKEKRDLLERVPEGGFTA